MASKVNHTVESQIETVNKTLSGLRPCLTASDRKAAIAELKLSEPTLIRYLNGKAKQLDTAITLRNFLRNRIEERAREIAA
jgi:hypothetical protein